MIVRVANNPKLLLGSMLAVFSACVAAFSVLEGFGIVDSIYWGVATSVTVGYGDVAPKTAPGRLLASFLMIVMVFFYLNLIVAYVVGKIVDDKNVFTSEEQEQMKKALAFLCREVDELDGQADMPDGLEQGGGA